MFHAGHEGGATAPLCLTSWKEKGTVDAQFVKTLEIIEKIVLGACPRIGLNGHKAWVEV